MGRIVATRDTGLVRPEQRNAIETMGWLSEALAADRA